MVFILFGWICSRMVGWRNIGRPLEASEDFTAAMIPERNRFIRQALVLEYATVIWNVVEGLVAVGAGISSKSIALIGFGLDSFIEVTSAVALIWRLGKNNPDDESQAEAKALRIVAGTFFLLALYVAVDSIKTLWLRERPSESLTGLCLTGISLVVMPVLAFGKSRLAERLESRALEADSKETLICSILSAIVFAGLGLNALFGWWWADPVAGLIMVGFLIKEGREAWEGTCSCH
jgi:divalent metal cation (Fe/Co/Zn/Cd) transporter